MNPLPALLALWTRTLTLLRSYLSRTISLFKRLFTSDSPSGGLEDGVLQRGAGQSPGLHQGAGEGPASASHRVWWVVA
ncbi:MAG: hypothetical protein ACOYKZ_08200, partial [Chlamydiia bacterium]